MRIEGGTEGGNVVIQTYRLIVHAPNIRSYTGGVYDCIK